MNDYIAQDLSDEIENIKGLIEVIIKKDYCRVSNENPEEHYQHALININKMHERLDRLTNIVDTLPEEEDDY